LAIHELSLFTGAGGGIWATKYLLGWQTVGYVEIDDYCQRVIRRRIDDGHFDNAPIFGDIRVFLSEGYAESYQGMVDVITAGFPCQPFSVAGKQERESDPRNLWPETIHVIRKAKPKCVLLENVPGIRQYLPVVIRDLRRTGYTVKRPTIIAAASVGAGHIRNRVWIYAYINKKRQQNNKGFPTAEKKIQKRGASCLDDGEKVFTHPYEEGQLQQEGGVKNFWRWISNCSWWETEPNLVRVVYGVPYGEHRIGALGNAQVPAVVATAWNLLTDTEL